MTRSVPMFAVLALLFVSALSTPSQATAPLALLPPIGVTATPGDTTVTLTWLPSAGAASYLVSRRAGSESGFTVIATGVLAPPFVDRGLTNGTRYTYQLRAVSGATRSEFSERVSAVPLSLLPQATDPAILASFRLLRQATWGPKRGELAEQRARGVEGFLSEQFAAPVSRFPNTLFDQPFRMTQDHFMQLAMTGPDQLRQRLAWALHKIWVVSAVDVDDPAAFIHYYRILLNGAFGNYRDLMRRVTLNPAMGRYLDMLNNRAEEVTGTAANENYARELMQLFTVGIPRLNPDGSIARDAAGLEQPVYSETDVTELARIFTGWTFGDGDPTTIPTRRGDQNFRVPMEAVARLHDSGAKTFMGEAFPEGQTAEQDLDQALDILFHHPNVGPFIGRQLIQQFVTSNPSPAYVAAVASAFNDNGTGVRGDMQAVIRAVLTHPEASASSPDSGKLSEPVLFVVSQLRALDVTVADYPFMRRQVEDMGQKLFYPGSVFSYFSPGYRVRGTVGPTGAPLGGPEFQILTAVTAMVRANFVRSLLAGQFGDSFVLDLDPFLNRADDPAALVDYCSRIFMGTRMSQQTRAEIIDAVRVSRAGQERERVRTAIYLTLVAAQSQVDW